MDTLRIVLLGKTSDGKSSSGNLILGEDVFPTGSSPNSQTQKCNFKSKSIKEKKISVVDTPGFFDTDLSSEELKSEMLRCLIECAPGPHAFVIVLKVGRYTKQEIVKIVKEITNQFGEEALKYAVVLFTFGDQLSKNETIEDFVKRSTELQDLVKKCGGRVHVIDNKYWNEQQDEYRSNSVQVQKLLNTIEEMVKNNGGKCYTNEVLQAVDEAIDAEFKALCETSKEKPDMNMMREQAKQSVHTKLLVRLVGTLTGALLGAFFGIVAAVDTVRALLNSALGRTAAAAVVSMGVPESVVVQAGALGLTAVGLTGAVQGGITGYHAVEGVDNVRDAVKTAAKETMESVQNVVENIDEFFSGLNPTDNHKFKQN